MYVCVVLYVISTGMLTVVLYCMLLCHYIHWYAIAFVNIIQYNVYNGAGRDTYQCITDLCIIV